MIDDIIVILGWDQAAQWGKKEKNGVKWENIGKQSKTSGGLGMGKGRRSLETCLWHPFHSPDYTSWLASLAIFFPCSYGEPDPRLLWSSTLYEISPWRKLKWLLIYDRFSLEIACTVKPLWSGHLRDLPKCPLNRGCLLNRGLQKLCNVC